MEDHGIEKTKPILLEGLLVAAVAFTFVLVPLVLYVRNGA